MKKINFTEKLKIFSIIVMVIILSLFSACSDFEIEWFGDIYTELENNLSTVYTFYAFTEEETENPETFQQTYKIGKTLKDNELPLKSDSRTKSFKPGYDVVAWKVYRNTSKPAGNISEIIYTTYGNESICSITVTQNPVDLVAIYTVASDTPYKVCHYKQNKELNGYDLYDTENREGTTNEYTRAEALEIPGFHSLSFEQIIIEADGSSVVNVYYDRNYVTIQIKTDEEDAGVSKQGYFELPVSDYVLPDRISEGLEFEKWKIEYESGAVEYQTEKDLTFPKENATYTAIWKNKSAKTGISITYPESNDAVLGLKVTYSLFGGSINYIADINSGFTAIRWFYDGEQILNRTEMNMTISKTLEYGYHSISVVALADGKIWSSEAIIEIKEE